MRQVIGFVPVHQVLEGPQQEGTGAAGGVHDLDLGSLVGGFAFQQLPNGVFNDVIHDVLGGVIDAAGFAHLGLFLDLCLVPGRQADHLAQKLLINLPKDLDRNLFEDIGAGVVEALDDRL